VRPAEVVIGGVVALFLGGAFTTAFLHPGWLFAYFIGAFVVMLVLAKPIGLLIDGWNAGIIRRHLVRLGIRLGILEAEVKPFPNHYGVRFSVNGQKYYAKCSDLRWGALKWRGHVPQDVVTALLPPDNSLHRP
jgi:hypothetical protein